ncbi:MAG TPA: hypothetical protein PLK37_08625 [Terricaulis sp.]|nr:hypothetical protein [Terricaulis sp.]
MGNFFSAMFEEMGQRRRRLRAAFGDRGQAIFEFLILAGLALGSLGLLVRLWMPAAAPWGFAIPFVFAAGFLLIERRRQRARAADPESETVRRNYDWAALLWSVGCALAGAAAFVIAWGAEPPPAPEEEIWTPPESSVPVDISP